MYRSRWSICRLNLPFSRERYVFRHFKIGTALEQSAIFKFPTQEGVGTLVVDIMVGHRQSNAIADLLFQIGRTRARKTCDVGALITEVNLLPGLLPQCSELIRGVAEVGMSLPESFTKT